MPYTLPCKTCNGRCCKNPIFTREEYDLVKEKYGVPAPDRVIDIGIDFVGLSGICPYLGKDRCSIYEDRPSVCKEYGETIPCKY